MGCLIGFSEILLPLSCVSLYAQFLILPFVSVLFQIVPLIWNSANVIPIPKVHPPRNIESDHRPISLVPTMYCSSKQDWCSEERLQPNPDTTEMCVCVFVCICACACVFVFVCVCLCVYVVALLIFVYIALVNSCQIIAWLC